MATIIQFRELVQRYRHLDRVQRRVDLLREKLRLNDSRLAGLRYDIEQTDLRVARLEGFHPARLYAQLMNRHRTELSEAKDRLFARASEYNLLVEANDLIEFEVGILSEKLTQVTTVRNEILERTLSGTGSLVLLYPDLKRRIHVYQKDISYRRRVAEMAREALELVALARQQLTGLEEELRRAEHAGESFIGRTIGSKRLILRNVERNLRAQPYLAQFMKKLVRIRREVRPHPHLRAQIGTFNRNVFQRKFKQNWAINLSLRKSRERLRDALLDLKSFHDRLEQLRVRLDDDITTIHTNCENLVMTRMAA